MSETKVYQLPQASIKYLRDLINTPSWADNLWKIRNGGAVYDILPEPSIPENTKAWAETLLPEFTLTDKQTKAVCACIRFYLPKAALPANKYSVAILDAFGISDEKDGD